MAQAYIQGAELPDRTFDWKDYEGSLIDFSANWSFSLKVANQSKTTQFTKTTGITGSATSPNITIAWATSGELNSLTPGRYIGYLSATRVSDSKNRTLQFPIVVKPGPS